MLKTSEQRIVSTLKLIAGYGVRLIDCSTRLRVSVNFVQCSRMWSIDSGCLQKGHSSVRVYFPFFHELSRCPERRFARVAAVRGVSTERYVAGV